MSLQRIAANAVSLFLAYLFPRLLTFGAIVVAARMPGTATFGAYGTAAAFAVILSILASLGMMPLLIREIARRPDHASMLLKAAHVTKTAANVGMLLVLVVLARWVLRYPEPVVTAAVLLGMFHALAAYAENLGAYYQAVERMHVWMEANALAGLVTGVLGMAAVIGFSSLTLFCAALPVGQLAALGWLLHRAPPGLHGGPPARRQDIAALARTLRPFLASAVAVAAYYKIDVLLLTQLRSAHDVGVYTAARKFLDVWHALILVGIGAVYPRLARPPASAGGATATRLLDVTLLGVVPAALLLFLLRAPLVLALYGSPYAAAATALGWLAFAAPMLAINLLGAYLLAVEGRMALVAGLYLAGLGANVLANLLLIPALAGTGAALALLISEGLLAAGFLTVLARTLGAAPRLGPLRAALGAAACGALAVLLVRAVGPLPAALAFGAAVPVLYRRAGVCGRDQVTSVIRALRGAFDYRPATGASGA